jgi:hypothetical protein
MLRFTGLLQLAVLCGFVFAAYVDTSFAQEDCPEPSCPPTTAYIYGKSGWYSTGDTIQFVGDSGVGLLGGERLRLLRLEVGELSDRHGLHVQKSHELQRAGMLVHGKRHV